MISKISFKFISRYELIIFNIIQIIYISEFPFKTVCPVEIVIGLKPSVFDLSGIDSILHHIVFKIRKRS